jgi:hypothetical protein
MRRLFRVEEGKNSERTNPQAAHLTTLLAHDGSGGRFWCFELDKPETATQPRIFRDFAILGKDGGQIACGDFVCGQVSNENATAHCGSIGLGAWRRSRPASLRCSFRSHRLRTCRGRLITIRLGGWICVCAVSVNLCILIFFAQFIDLAL